MSHVIVVYADAGLAGFQVLKSLEKPVIVDQTDRMCLFLLDEKTSVLAVCGMIETESALKAFDKLGLLKPNRVTVLTSVISSEIPVGKVLSTTRSMSDLAATAKLNDHFLCALMSLFRLSEFEYEFLIVSFKKGQTKECFELLCEKIGLPIFSFNKLSLNHSGSGSDSIDTTAMTSDTVTRLEFQFKEANSAAFQTQNSRFLYI